MDENTKHDDGVPHGIIFMCMNASIERQFEFMQSQWVNHGNEFQLGGDKDPIIGNHHPGGKVVIPGKATKQQVTPPFICRGLEPFVRTRGGDYFFLPSLTALRHIAAGTVEPK